MTNTNAQTYIKFLLATFFLTLLVILSAPIVSADTVDRTRAVITRSTDTVHERESRGDSAVEEEEEADEEEDDGIVVNVSSNQDGHVNIDLDTSGFQGNVTITINGQSVNASGNQSGSSPDSSSGGADGAEGADGASGGNDEAEDDNNDEGGDEEVETDSRSDTRGDRDIVDRTSDRR